jgi:hypothetical protein
VSFHAAASLCQTYTELHRVGLAKSPYHIAPRNGILMSGIFQLFGVLTGLLAVWLFWCDHTNEFLLVLFPVALLLMGMGEVMQ